MTVRVSSDVDLGDKLTWEVVYKDMKEGFMASDTDYGTRELREIYKGMSS